MNVLRELRRPARVLIGPALGIALTGYFAYNLVEGDRGFLAWRRLTQQIRAENARLDSASRRARGARAEGVRSEARIISIPICSTSGCGRP